jgi:hypothetical protein
MVPSPQPLGKYGSLTGFTLVSCPRCAEEVIELVSKSDKNPGKIFFKCCMNVVDVNDLTICSFVVHV